MDKNKKYVTLVERIRELSNGNSSRLDERVLNGEDVHDDDIHDDSNYISLENYVIQELHKYIYVAFKLGRDVGKIRLESYDKNNKLESTKNTANPHWFLSLIDDYINDSVFLKNEISKNNDTFAIFPKHFSGTISKLEQLDIIDIKNYNTVRLKEFNYDDIEY